MADTAPFAKIPRTVWIPATAALFIVFGLFQLSSAQRVGDEYVMGGVLDSTAVPSVDGPKYRVTVAYLPGSDERPIVPSVSFLPPITPEDVLAPDRLADMTQQEREAFEQFLEAPIPLGFRGGFEAKEGALIYTGGTNSPREIGSEVRVYYDPERPERASFTSGSTTRSRGGLLLVGGSFVVIGWLAVLAYRRLARRTAVT